MATLEYTVDLTWPGVGSPGVHVWHFRTDILDGAQDCVNVIRGFYALFDGYPLLPSGSSASGRSEAIDVASSEIEPVTGWTENTGGVNGTFSGSNQLTMTIGTSSATRAGRGRKFIGPVVSGCEDFNGTPTGTAIANLTAMANDLLANSQALDGAAIGVYSRTQNIFRDMTSVRVPDRFAVLRSRRD